MAQQSQPGRREPTGEGVTAKNAARDTLEQGNGACEVRIHYDGRTDVEHTAHEAGPQDREPCGRATRRSCHVRHWERDPGCDAYAWRGDSDGRIRLPSRPG